MRMYLVLALLLALTPHAHAFGRRVALDPVTSSTLVDGDATGLSEGCGQQPSPLGMFCRMTEGSVVAESISFIAPPAKCNKDSCAYVKVWNGQSQLVFGGSIPKGSTRITVPWTILLGRNTVELNDRGLWAFNTTVYFIDKDGNEREATSQGDIILRVTKKGYLPLNNVTDDPSFIWEWIDNHYIYKVTSGLRAYVAKVVP